jgi:hypothetical protein
MIPAGSQVPQALEAFPDAPAALRLDDGPPRLHHGPSARRRVRRPPIPRRPRQPDRPARGSNRALMLRDQDCAHLAPRGRRHPFRGSTALSAAFSSASAASIGLRFAFSPSSSFLRRSSATDVPAYFDRHRK